MNIFNLSTVEKASRGFDVEIKHPVTGKPTGAVIKVYGQDAPEFKRLNHEFKKELRESDIELSDDEIKIKLVTMAVITWSGVCDADGEISCTSDNCENIFRNVPAVFEQVSAAIFDRANFIAG